MKESGLYIHIPFCDHKCVYCDFYSITKFDEMDRYAAALEIEMKHYAALFSSSHYFTSVFFGGGTPSLMPPRLIEGIINSLHKFFNISADAEITLETNPGTVNFETLKSFKSSGINRISIGIQSFDDEDLKFLTRVHNSKEAITTVRQAAEIFTNINIDLIFNLPNQTKEKWLLNLEQAINLPVSHISAYSLILERGTILNKLVKEKKVTISDEDYDAQLYGLTIDFLTSRGFNHYEVSNFTKVGHECRHNNHYWRYNNYLGFGTSAHSFMNNERWNNFRSLRLYMESVAEDSTAVASRESISAESSHDEYVMLALRSKGLDLNEYETMFANKIIINSAKLIEDLIAKKYLYKEKGLLKLTGKGYCICDEILVKILFP